MAVLLFEALQSFPGRAAAQAHCALPAETAALPGAAVSSPGSSAAGAGQARMRTVVWMAQSVPAATKLPRHFDLAYIHCCAGLERKEKIAIHCHQ